MKIVGKEKAKPSWCMMLNTQTSHYYVGYDGNWPLHGGYKAVQAAIDEAQASPKPEPVILPEVEFPGYHVGYDRTGRVFTQAEKDTYAAYQAYNSSLAAHRFWAQEDRKRFIEPLDFDPIFEDELRFVGYTRGRSSVTMQFEASNGQIIEFGPSGIDGLITGIIEGVAKPQDISGTYETEGDWNPTTGEHENKKTLPRGRGIKAVFKFVKKGSNVYAELTEI